MDEQEETAAALAASLQDGGDWRQVLTLFGDPPGDHESVRETLLLLGEYDLRLLAQVGLEAIALCKAHGICDFPDHDGFTRPPRDPHIRRHR
jgi:hypothetical protein